MNTAGTSSYINEFLYFTITPDRGSDKNAIVCCSGVNLTRFLPLTKKRHGVCSNPALRGLQLVKRDLKMLALSKEAVPITVRRKDCAGIAPTKDNWFTEILLIEKASVLSHGEIIDHCVTDLMKKILGACRLESELPERMLRPDELQTFLEAMCKKHGTGGRNE